MRGFVENEDLMKVSKFLQSLYPTVEELSDEKKKEILNKYTEGKTDEQILEELGTRDLILT